MLHAVFLVENFLYNLVRRKCNFHVVFFDSNAELSIPPATSIENRPKYDLARSVIIAHLRAHLPTACPNTGLYSFKSIRDAAFKTYLQVHGTYFIMCHDGAIFDSSTALDIETENADAKNFQSNEEEILRKTKLRSMIFTFIAQGYNAALVNGLEWLDTKVLYTEHFLSDH